MRAGLIVCLVATACAAESPVDPADLELRDLLGISPEAASAWDSQQRSAARHVIEGGLHHVEPAAIAAPLDPAGDQRIGKALAAIDADRAHRDAGALGLVQLTLGDHDLRATTRASTIGPHATASVELELAGWEAEPQLPARGMEVLSAIAIDAGHTSGPVVVSPAPRLAMVAGYLPATAGEHAHLLVNPILLAALEPVAGEPAPSIAKPIARLALPPAVRPDQPSRLATPSDAGAVPYFYGSIGECATAEYSRCAACLPSGTCTAITSGGDGNAECTQLAANDGRGDFLICINLALAIDQVSTCAAELAPSCAQDTHASGSIASLANNADFLDAACAGPLDTCLTALYGPPPRSSGPDAGISPTHNPAMDGCDDSGCDGGCDSCDSGDDDDSGDDGGSCDDCSGDDDSGGDCGGDSGGDCGGDGGDCSGGGGDCSGGGDCGGGGGDCNAGTKHGHHGAGVGLTIVWAFLPVPFAARVRRRAVRKRATEEHEGSS